MIVSEAFEGNHLPRLGTCLEMECDVRVELIGEEAVHDGSRDLQNTVVVPLQNDTELLDVEVGVGGEGGGFEDGKFESAVHVVYLAEFERVPFSIHERDLGAGVVVVIQFGLTAADVVPSFGPCHTFYLLHSSGEFDEVDIRVNGFRLQYIDVEDVDMRIVVQLADRLVERVVDRVAVEVRWDGEMIVQVEELVEFGFDLKMNPIDFGWRECLECGGGVECCHRLRR